MKKPPERCVTRVNRQLNGSQVHSKGCCHARCVWSEVLHCAQTSILANVHPEKIDVADVPIVALQLLAEGNVRLR